MARCSLNSLNVLTSRSTFQVVSGHRKVYLRQPVTGEPLEKDAGTECCTLLDLLPLKCSLREHCHLTSFTQAEVTEAAGGEIGNEGPWGCQDFFALACLALPLELPGLAKCARAFCIDFAGRFLVP